MNEWTDDPKETGAYWFQIAGYGRSEICWVHDGRVWFAPAMPGDKNRVGEWAQYGKCFSGPLPRPPERP